MLITSKTSNLAEKYGKISATTSWIKLQCNVKIIFVIGVYKWDPLQVRKYLTYQCFPQLIFTSNEKKIQ